MGVEQEHLGLLPSDPDAFGGTRPDPLLWLIPLFLTGLGVLVITSTTSPLAFAHEGTAFSVGLRQFRSLLIGLLGLLTALAVPTRFWLRISGFLWVLGLLLTFATLVPGIGTTVGGARRWIRLGGLSIQAGEFLFLALTLHLSKLLYRDQRDTVQAFVLIADFASFTRAAQALDTSQAAISLKLKRLEERLGYRLLQDSTSPRAVAT